jgi:hypothetical protein
MNEQPENTSDDQGGVAQLAPPSIAFAIQVQFPIPNQPARVVADQGMQGHICAVGTAGRPDGAGANPVQVFAQIYPGQLGLGAPNVPAQPPPTALAIAPMGQMYAFPNVGGALASAMAPFPWNTLVIWAQFNDPNNPFDRSFTPFQGQLAATTDCGGN